ncbi:MAG: prepilin-type N-terminal cleavage/methylation domain-containing protein [Ethanoligenens sp.]
MMKKLTNFFKKAAAARSGVTLIEMVLSIALLAIVSIVLAQVLLSTIAGNGHSQAHMSKSVQAAGAVAADSATTSTDSAGGKIDVTQAKTSDASGVTITINGNNLTVSGTMTTGTITLPNGQQEIIYKSFQPN